MKHFIWLGILFLMTLRLSAVTFMVAVPENTPPQAEIFMAGSFNEWAPGERTYMLEEKDSLYQITLPLKQGQTIQYKFTRGSWDTVEKGTLGDEISNRIFTNDGKTTVVKVRVQNWRDFVEDKTKHSISGNVITLDQFPIPQLKTTRRVWIYLPPDYDKSHDKYPVLYMQDGQNLFDAATSFAGEWKIDETIDRLVKEGKTKGVIVVGVDNGGAERMNEYSPWKSESYNGGGKGNHYVEFLVQTLKPYIDSHYRTLKEKQFTGIAGSSMGGFIALYAAMRFPDVFGKVGVFSPAFWFNKFAMREMIKLAGPQPTMRVYLDVGTDEGEKKDIYVRDAREIYQLLSSSGYAENNVMIRVDEGAQHNEAAWEKRFPDAFLWLFEEN